MMKFKALFHWLYERGSSYNLFKPEDNGVDPDAEPKDPAIVLKHQKYTTRLYVLLFTGKYRTQSFSS